MRILIIANGFCSMILIFFSLCWNFCVDTSLFKRITPRHRMHLFFSLLRSKIFDLLNVFINMFYILYFKNACLKKTHYRIFFNKCRASNKRCTFGYSQWSKRFPLVSAAPQNTALIRVVTVFYQKLNQNTYGTSMQTIKQKYCWYFRFFIICNLLIVKIYVSFLFWRKKWQGFDIWYCSFP